MDVRRILRHWLTPPWRVRQVFPASALRAIEQATRRCELQHAGQIRFAVETTLSPRALLAGQSARDRAVEVFSGLRVWDTEQNNGVLIYLLLADRDVEIIADRGIHARVGETAWQAIRGEMEQAFRRGEFLPGALAGIEAVGERLIQHYPHAGEKPNELPDRPVLL